MARIMGLDDEMAEDVRYQLAASLRPLDEAIVLPQAHRSVESGAFKNVVMRLNGKEGDLTGDLFSPNWFSGVSVVQVDDVSARRLLEDPTRRKRTLATLVNAIVSETDSADVQVGPALDGDEYDRDTEEWQAGFDGPGCCIGLYSAQQARAPHSGANGMHRAHMAYYLVCKAGAGVAAQTFHTRLSGQLSKGVSLNECFAPNGIPGAQALRRVSLAGQRNRARLLAVAAQALGIYSIDTVNDNASFAGSDARMVITQTNVHTNVIREEGDFDATASKTWLYTSGCIDTTSGHGLVASSNVAEGFVLLTDSNGDARMNLRNSAHNALPFASQRLRGIREVVMQAAEARLKQKASGSSVHPDASWIHERFGWKRTDPDFDIEPAALWGTHDSIKFISLWNRELGISNGRVEVLEPQLVALAALPREKLRAAKRYVMDGRQSR